MGGCSIRFISTKPVLTILTISIYIFSLVSAIIVKPYWSISIAVIYLLIGIYIMSNFLYSNKGLVGIALITNSIFVGLGQYLEYYIPLISFLTNILGAALSIFSVVIFYYWKEGQRRVQIHIRNERLEDTQKKASKFSKILIVLKLFKRQRELIKEKGYPKMLAFQFAYIESLEEKMKKEEKNALDFVLGKEVILQRNEYDQSPEK